MAIWFVDSNAGGANDGTSWTDAYVTLDRALDSAINTGLAAGDFVYVHVGASSPHSETGASTVGATGTGTAINPIKVLGVDQNNSDALTVSTIKNVQATSSQLVFSMTALYVYGVWFYTDNADIFVGENDDFLYCFERCTMQLDSTATGRNIDHGAGGTGTFDQFVEYIDCDIGLSTSGFGNQGLFTDGARVVWRGGGLVEGTIGGWPSIIVDYARFGSIDVIGVDLSDLQTTGYLVNQSLGSGRVSFQNCELPSTIAGFVRLAGSDTYHNIIQVYKSHSGTDSDPSYEYFSKSIYGEVDVSTTIYRNGGWTDGERTNPLSYECTAKANKTISLYAPLNVNELAPFTVWTDGDGSTAQTYTVEVASDTTYQDDELWIVYEYPSETSTSSLTDIQSTRLAPLGTPSNVTTSSETWTGGAPVATEQKLSITVTPDKPGVVRAWVYFAPGSGTDEIIYVDPKITVS